MNLNELDEKMAKVMEWHTKHLGRLWWCDSKEHPIIETKNWHPSTDISQAMMVLEKTGYWFLIDNCEKEWRVFCYPPNRITTGQDKNLSMAICLVISRIIGDDNGGEQCLS